MYMYVYIYIYIYKCRLLQIIHVKYYRYVYGG